MQHRNKRGKRALVDVSRNFHLSAVCLFAVISLAGALFASSDNPLGFYVQETTFRGDSTGYYYEEFQLALSRDRLTFVSKDTLFIASFSIRFSLIDSLGATIDTFESGGDVLLPADAMVSKPYAMVDYIPALLKQGRYTAVFDIVDILGRRAISDTIPVIVDALWDDDYALSDIMFLSAVMAGDSGRFNRWGALYYPYPAARYTASFPMLRFAVELYHNKSSVALPLRARVEIRDRSNSSVRRFTPQPVDWRSGLFTSAVNVIGLPAGEYSLVVSLVDSMENEYARSERAFSVIKGRARGGAAAELSLSERDAAMSLLLSPDEFSAYQEMDTLRRYDYWRGYWERQSAKSKDDFLVRWNYVAVHFESAMGQRNGYETDMGRIYLRYGPPDDIERHRFSIETNEWEKWIYPEGYFIFGDIYNLGRMQLLTSNVSGEREDPDWYSKLQRIKANTPGVPGSSPSSTGELIH